MIETLAAAGGSFAPVDQGYLLEARQMQALSLAPASPAAGAPPWSSSPPRRGVTSLGLVWRSRFEPARVAAAAAVAAIVAGWGLAQAPRFLPGLTIEQAAAGHSTLVAVVVSAAIGAVVLVPSLVLLFRLFLKRHLDAHGAPDVQQLPHREAPASTSGLGTLAVATLVIGVGATVFIDPDWGRIIGVPCLVAGALSMFALATAGLGDDASCPAAQAAAAPRVGCGRPMGYHANGPGAGSPGALALPGVRPGLDPRGGGEEARVAPWSSNEARPSSSGRRVLLLLHGA